MNNYSESTYGEHIAKVYDLWYTEFDQSTISTLVELSKGGRALELGMTALAITDHDGLYGVVRFWRAATERGIRPIIGSIKGFLT